MIIEIEARMSRQDGQAGANEHHHEKEVQEVAVTDPDWKSVRASEVGGVNFGNRRNSRQTARGKLNPGSEDQGQNPNRDADQNGRSNPNPEAAVLWVMHCRVFCIERNHDLNSRD